MFTYMDFEKKSDKGVPLQPYTWKGNLRNFLHSKPCHCTPLSIFIVITPLFLLIKEQIAVIVLTLVDVVLVMVEIILDLKNVEDCEGEHAEESIGAEVVHYMSISILSIFLVEIALKLIADWQHFWSHKMEIFDAFVVIIAFACDVAVTFIGTDALAAVGLLIMLRLWRVVRVINGIILTVKNEGDERVHALKDKVKEMEEDMDRKDNEIRKLKDLLHQNSIDIEEAESGVTRQHVTIENNGAVDA